MTIGKARQKTAFSVVICCMLYDVKNMSANTVLRKKFLDKSLMILIIEELPDKDDC